MLTPMSIAKHPIHVMLVMFPVALWIFSLICDITRYLGGAGIWGTVAYMTMFAGWLGALGAAVPGLIDMISIRKGTALKKMALTHMAINLVLLLVYGLNIAWRTHDLDNMVGPMLMSLVSVVALSVSAWIGAEMVHVHGVGVESTHNTAELDIDAGRQGGKPARTATRYAENT